MAWSLTRILKLIAFYGVFYSILAGFFGVMFVIFIKTLDDKQPKRQLEDSLIGNIPALDLHPTTFDGIIRYRAGDLTSSTHWVKQLNEFLSPYEEQTKYENIDNCEGKDKPDDKKFCEFAFNHEFAPCIKDSGYGFGNKQGGGPCIFLKLNKIYGWTPEYYTNATAPSKMPRHLQQQIAQKEQFERHRVVWVDCAGKNLADIENIGAVSYYPQRGFQEKYFPFQNVDGYISPFVAVHFENPKRGTLINIECKAWARNIHHDRVNRRGSVHFKLLVD